MQDNREEQTRLALRGIRLSLVDNTMTSLQDLTSGLQINMLNAIGTGEAEAQDLVATEAENALEEVVSRLGARNAERFLFSGDATATPPFQDPSVLLDDLRAIAAGAIDEADFAAQVDFYFDDPTGGFQTNYYQGAQTASDPESVVANQPEFRDLIQGLAIMALSHNGSGEPFARGGTPAMDQALERISRGRTNLVETQA
ncbi:MAG: hypothetical protein AAFV37_06715, partial [Pseudomonadota bacterium]